MTRVTVRGEGVLRSKASRFTKYKKCSILSVIDLVNHSYIHGWKDNNVSFSTVQKSSFYDNFELKCEYFLKIEIFKNEGEGEGGTVNRVTLTTL